MGEHKLKEETNEKLTELQKQEGIKLLYIGLLNKTQELAGTLKVDAETFKHDEEAAVIFEEYGAYLSDLVKKLSLHIASM